MRSDGVKAECGVRSAESKAGRRFRIQHSAFRILLALSVACSAPPAPNAVSVTIPPGATLDAAIDSLSARDVVRHPTLFRWYARVRGLRGSLKTGDYVLPPGAAWSDIVATLERGHGVEVRWTVREGLMLGEVADLAALQIGIPRDSLLVAAGGDPALRQELGLPPTATSVEGYLFPTTYVVPVHITARELVRVMTREFLAQWQPDWTPRLDSLHMTRQQLVTLASIIEAEVRYDPDRPFISAVYRNRLARGMKLEADPTVIYAYGRRLKRVWEKNLAVRSRYNTYLHPGLPPGPICQPGRASLAAALDPAPVPFLYFVAQPDGKHIFSVTYAEHEAAIRTVKRMRIESRGRRPPGR
jgi:peptidoglycan lytic transglycosylase G